MDSKKRKQSFVKTIQVELQKNWQLYMLLIIPVAYVIIFSYVPMAGLRIAFTNHRLAMSIWEAPIHPNGALHHFRQFLNNPRFWEMFNNTIILSLYGMVVGSIMPLALALVINNIVVTKFKKTVQMITYAPHFISAVVMVGILTQIFGVRTGFINNFLFNMGFDRIDFFARPGMFRHLFVWSAVWQSNGFNAVIYIAALAGIDPQLHEAAVVDGASRLRRIWHIDLPGIIPTFVLLLILSAGGILTTGAARVILFQNPLNISTSRVIDSYLFERGLGFGVPGMGGGVPQFAYAAAVGMTQSVVGLIMVLGVNRISKKLTDTGLW